MHTLLPWQSISGSGAAAGDSPFIRCDKKRPLRTCGTRSQIRIRHSAQGSLETKVSRLPFGHFWDCGQKCPVPGARNTPLEIFRILSGTMWAPWSAAEQVPLGCIVPYKRAQEIPTLGGQSRPPLQNAARSTYRLRDMITASPTTIEKERQLSLFFSIYSVPIRVYTAPVTISYIVTSSVSETSSVIPSV